MFVPPRLQQVPYDCIERTSDRVELSVRFPGGVQARDASWVLEGDVLDVAHDLLHPPYHKCLLVPPGGNLAVSVEDCELRVVVHSANSG